MDDYDKLLKQLQDIRDIQGLDDQVEVPYRRPEDMEQQPLTQNQIVDQIQEEQEMDLVDRAPASVQTNIVNKQAKSPYMQEKPETPEFDIDKERLDLYNQYKTLSAKKPEPRDGDAVLNWLTGIGQGANVLNQVNNITSPQVEYWQDRLQRAQGTENNRELDRVQKLQKMLQTLGTKGSQKNKIYQTRSGLVRLDKDGNPEQIYEDPYMKTGAEARRDSLNLRKDKFDFSKGEKEKDRLEKVVKEFNSDPVMRDSKKAVIAADKARSIIDKGGKMAPAVMGRLLARMAGEVGVMTDQDVAAFRGSAAWNDSLERYFQKGIQGTLTETDKTEMRNMVDNLVKIEQQAIEGYADNISRQYSESAGVDREEILKSVLPKKAKEIYKLDKVEVELPNGQKGRIDADKVDAFKKKYPKAKILK